MLREYEAENDFSPVYHCIDPKDEHHNQPYRLIGRHDIPKIFYALKERNAAFNCDIAKYPMWKIEFADGDIAYVYASEIILRSIIENHYRVAPGTKPLTLEEVKMPINERGDKQTFQEPEKEYRVRRHYLSTVTVKASSPEEALNKAGDYTGNFQLLDEDEVEEIPER